MYRLGTYSTRRPHNALAWVSGLWTALPRTDNDIDMSYMYGGGALDPEALSRMTVSGDEFLFKKPAAVQRPFMPSIMYATGTSYVSGLAVGGTWGMLEGLRRPDGESTKLRINSLLNGCTRRGPFVGNSLGVIGEQHHRLRSSAVLCACVSHARCAAKPCCTLAQGDRSRLCARARATTYSTPLRPVRARASFTSARQACGPC